MFVPHLCLMLDPEFLGQLTDEDRARAVARQLAEQSCLVSGLASRYGEFIC